MEEYNATELEKIREEISESRKKRKTCITICGGTGCHAYGCLKVAQAFKDEIKSQGLQDKVDVRTTGCHGFCERGPIVVIQPKGVFYQKIKLEDIKEVIAETIVGKKIIDRLLYVDPRTQEKIVREKNVPFYKKQKRIIFGNNGFIDPTDIRDYIALDGYKALTKILFDMIHLILVDNIGDGLYSCPFLASINDGQWTGQYPVGVTESHSYPFVPDIKP